MATRTPGCRSCARSRASRRRSATRAERTPPRCLASKVPGTTAAPNMPGTGASTPTCLAPQVPGTAVRLRERQCVEARSGARFEGGDRVVLRECARDVVEAVQQRLAIVRVELEPD